MCERERERERVRVNEGKCFARKGKKRRTLSRVIVDCEEKCSPYIYIYIYTVIKREIDYTVRNAGQICRERPWECATSSREKRNRETCPSTP